MAPHRSWPAVLLAIVLVAPADAAAGQPGDAATRDRALRLAYDLDYREALAILRHETEAHPDDPAAHRALASVLWLELLHQRGSVTVDHYLGSLSRASVDLPPPPAATAAAFTRHVEAAIGLGEAATRARPRDPDALYHLGAALGLRASYVATIEGRFVAGFRSARRAFDAHERVLSLDPSRRDAALIVGTYRYLVSTLSAPMRLMAYVSGFGGGRDPGIQLLQTAASQRGAGRADALFALVLVYNREQRYGDALTVLQELAGLYPRNRLILLEAGATALRGRQLERAEQLLDQGMALLARDTRPRIPGEEQLWRYKRGAVRVAAGRFEAAADDLAFATGPDGAAWVRGRARVERARAALVRGDRPAARSEASQGRALCASGRDPVCVADARALLRRLDGG
jgi:tetratricopeptide (TPR) repeat protein